MVLHNLKEQRGWTTLKKFIYLHLVFNGPKASYGFTQTGIEESFRYKFEGSLLCHTGSEKNKTNQNSAVGIGGRIVKLRTTINLKQINKEYFHTQKLVHHTPLKFPATDYSVPSYNLFLIDLFNFKLYYVWHNHKLHLKIIFKTSADTDKPSK